MTQPENLLLERDGRLAFATLDRRAASNALDTRLVRAISRAVRDLAAAEPAVRVLVLAGAGDAFCAGADVRELAGMAAPAARAFADAGQALCLTLEQARFPVIAAVQGLALGAGFELTLACDLVICAEDARFGLPEIHLGIMPGFGGTQRLVRRIGLPLARELCYSGRQLGAARAHALGLVTRVVPRAELAARARAEAEAIAARAPLAVAAIKRTTGAGAELGLADGCAMEAELFGELFATRDAREGARAFLEQRDPEFCGE